MERKTQIKQMNKKKKFVADGVFHAELHTFLTRALASAGYAGIEIRVTPVKTEIRIKAAKVQEVLGQDGLKIRELTSLVQKRFGYAPDAVDLKVASIFKKGMCASAQAEIVKFKLLKGVPVRMAAISVIRSVIKEGARGCEIIISGKLRQQRAKSMKFKQGYMICTGQPRLDFIDTAVRHVAFKQGIMGVKVMIMLPSDPTGKAGVKAILPDNCDIRDPKPDDDEPEIRNAPAPAAGQQ
jgi:small subunit ribosomal protein S3e